MIMKGRYIQQILMPSFHTIFRIFFKVIINAIFEGFLAELAQTY
jgi:hypothetical protein